MALKPLKMAIFSLNFSDFLLFTSLLRVQRQKRRKQPTKYGHICAHFLQVIEASCDLHIITEFLPSDYTAHKSQF